MPISIGSYPPCLEVSPYAGVYTPRAPARDMRVNPVHSIQNPAPRDYYGNADRLVGSPRRGKTIFEDIISKKKKEVGNRK